MKRELRKMDNQIYSEDKPFDCRYCYFFNDKKDCCTMKECYYAIPLKEEVAFAEGDCRGCAYGRASLCIGYCTLKNLMDLKVRREQNAGRGK
ncbi:MAG: hypothetical protein IJ224_09430 [Lachnospiraceae bacterium]|nr:hypothetical protein [Lachnospiraceae bacterium]